MTRTVQLKKSTFTQDLTWVIRFYSKTISQEINFEAILWAKKK